MQRVLVVELWVECCKLVGVLGLTGQQGRHWEGRRSREVACGSEGRVSDALVGAGMTRPWQQHSSPCQALSPPTPPRPALRCTTLPAPRSTPSTPCCTPGALPHDRSWVAVFVPYRHAAACSRDQQLVHFFGNANIHLVLHIWCRRWGWRALPPAPSRRTVQTAAPPSNTPPPFPSPSLQVVFHPLPHARWQGTLLARETLYRCGKT